MASTLKLSTDLFKMLHVVIVMLHLETLIEGVGMKDVYEMALTERIYVTYLNISNKPPSLSETIWQETC